MAGKAFKQMSKDSLEHLIPSPRSASPVRLSCQRSTRESTEVSSLGSLTDPLIQDARWASRKYLFYFASDVCKDLVLYDIPEHNPFRELVPLTYQHTVLFQIIIAISALHMSNATQRQLHLDNIASAFHDCSSLTAPACANSTLLRKPESYHDALVAKQRALSLLQSALVSTTSPHTDVVLAVVLLFIEYELIDSGRDNWRYHINGARTIIEKLCGSDVWTETATSPLRRCLVSNCLIFDTLGSAVACSNDLVPSVTFSTGAQSLLQDEEGKHCSSFLTSLLQILRTGAQLTLPNHPSYSSTGAKQQEAHFLLSAAASFDPLTWATNLQSHSPAPDLQYRVHVASAHQAAVCIYLSRVLKSLGPNDQVLRNLDCLVAEIISHLLHIRPSNPLFKATTWPTFIAGAETHGLASQEWVATRFEELWEIEPWGLLKGAVVLLERIWTGRRKELRRGGEDAQKELHRKNDWIKDLKGSGVDWLIL